MRPSSLPPDDPTGRTLRDLLRAEGALAFDHAARLLTSLTSDLAAIHAAGGVHGAITPQSIRIDEMGLARLGPPAADPDGSVGLLPPAYLAPERIDGDPADARSDVYTLGLIGWEMLAGETPFAGDSLREIVAQQHGRDLPRLTTLRPGVPRPLLFAIEGALHKQPDDRWADAGEMLTQLRQGSPELKRVVTPARAIPYRGGTVAGVVLPTGAERGARVSGEVVPGTRWGRRLSIAALLLAVGVAGVGVLVALQGRADRTTAAPWLDSLTTSASAGVLITKDTTGDTAARLRANRARAAAERQTRAAAALADSGDTSATAADSIAPRPDSVPARPRLDSVPARPRPDTIVDTLRTR